MKIVDRKFDVDKWQWFYRLEGSDLWIPCDHIPEVDNSFNRDDLRSLIIRFLTVIGGCFIIFNGTVFFIKLCF